MRGRDCGPGGGAGRGAGARGASARAAGLAVAAAAAGCGSLTSYHSAEPVAPGRARLAAALTGGGYRDAPQDARTPLLAAELEVRRGVVRDLDLGLKAYPGGGELSARWRFVERRWSWALDAAVGGGRADDAPLVSDGLLLHGRLAAIATRRTSPRWAFSVAPTLTVSRYWFDGGGAADGALLGVTGNAERRLGARWRLVPELGVHRTVAGDVPVDGAVLHLGLGAALEL